MGVIKTEDAFIKIMQETTIRKKLDEGELVSVQDLDDAAGDAVLNNTFPLNLSKYADKILSGERKAYNNLTSAMQINTLSFQLVFDTIVKEITETRNRTKHRIAVLKEGIRKAEDRINQLSMITADTAGLFYTYYETLLTMDNIDAPNSNAVIDLESQTVHCSYSASKEIIPKIFDSIKTSPYRQNGYISAGYVNAKTMDGVFSGEGSIYQIISSSPTGATVEFTIPISQAPIQFNMMEITAKNNIVSTSQDISVLVSDNGVTFSPVTSEPQALGWKIILPVDQSINVRYIKIILNKKTADTEAGSNYIYYFAIDKIRMFTNSTIGNGTLKTTGIQSPDLTSFDMVSIETCDQTPNDSDILYYLSRDNISWSEVWPINKPGIKYGTVDVFKTGATETILQTVQEDISSQNIFNFRSPNYTFLQQADTEVIFRTIDIFRDSNTIDLTNDEQMELRSNGLYRGWRETPGGRAACVFKTEAVETTIPLLTADSTTEKDPIKAYVNGRLYTSDMTVPAGIHTIEMSKDDHKRIHSILLNKSVFIAGKKLVRTDYNTFNSMTARDDLFCLVQFKLDGENVTRIAIQTFSGENTYYLISGNKEVTPCNTIYMKAILIPGSNGESPILHGYSIKLHTKK